MERLPEQIGPFRIRGLIGAGGMGVVYLGWDPRLDRNVALKTLRNDVVAEYDAHQLFQREARAVAAVSHPHIVQIYEIGEEQGCVYFAMEYLAGKSLHSLLVERGRLPWRDALEYVRQAAWGLSAAAKAGIVHRDVKPSNLVLSSDGRVKVTDFGLAKQSLTDSSPAASTVFIGSATYLAPERAAGQRADVRSDIYALGATLFELITGRPPFEGPSSMAVIAKHLREPPPALQTMVPDLPYPVGTFVQRTLAKKPEARPQTYDAFLRELDALTTPTQGPEVIELSPLEPEVGERPGSSAAGRLVVAAVCLLVAIGALGAWRHLEKQAAAAATAASIPASEAQPGPSEAEPQAAVLGEPSGGSAAGAERAPAPATRAKSRPTPKPRARPVESVPPPVTARARADLKVIESDHEITLDGRLRVDGVVENLGGRRAASARVRVSIVVDGEEREAVTVPLTPEILEPGARARFQTTLQRPQAGQIKLELEWLS